MLKDNLIMLRNINGFSQEQIAEKVGISRQAYAKWESGATVPDVDKCSLLADVYGVSLDSLVRPNEAEGVGTIPPDPKGKNIFGSVTISDRGQIVIPKEVRDRYGLTAGKKIIVLGDEEGIALLTADKFEEKMKLIFECAGKQL